MKIEVRFDGTTNISQAWVKKVVSTVLRSEKVGSHSVSVLLTDNKKIRAINKKYLGHDYATDVISFGLDEKNFLGDVVVSVEMARQKARELGIPFKEELARYLVHGVLHLIGYRDKTRRDYSKMHKKQEHILKKIV